jgi:hypothetical protein
MHEASIANHANTGPPFAANARPEKWPHSANLVRLSPLVFTFLDAAYLTSLREQIEAIKALQQDTTIGQEPQVGNRESGTVAG